MGVGSPGAVDAEAGIVAGARNLPDWEEAFPLALALSERLGCPVALGNDVQVAVDGEFALGRGAPRPLAPRRLVGHRRGRRDHPRRQALDRPRRRRARSATWW